MFRPQAFEHCTSHLYNISSTHIMGHRELHWHSCFCLLVASLRNK